MSAAIPKGKRKYRDLIVPQQWADWQALLFMFGTSSGEKRFYWLKELILLLWPPPVFIHDEWSDLFFAACCGAKETVERLTGVKIETDENWSRRVHATGAGSTGKSAKAAMYVLCCWLCDQQRTSVVLTSTGMEQLKRRIWYSLIKWIRESSVSLPLEALPSDCEIRWTEGDKLGCIFGIPVQAGGEEQKAIDRIKGIHNSCTILVIDEETSMPNAMDGVESNLRKGTLRHQVIGLGNASDRNDLHGRNMEPAEGWNSVTPEDVFWLTKSGGCALHFDGLKSPRLRDDARYHYYIGAEDIRIEREFGGGENNPRWWSEVRGWWPPAGLTQTVMDEPMLLQFETAKEAIWKNGFQMGAGFDPAFEGEDRAVLYPFKFGEFTSGVVGMELLPPIIVTGDASQDKRWLTYSIADAVQKHCESYTINDVKHSIPPENFMEDTTGEGGSFHSILSARWSPKIRGVEFGEACDKTPINAALPETWFERYGRKNTQIWFVFRAYVEGGQVRGLTDPETRKELCARKREMKAGKIIVEPKAKMKGRSPDKAEAACIAAFLLFSRGLMPAGHTASATAGDPDEWNAWADKVNLRDDTKDYSNEMSAFA